jgi:DNA-binding NarL/FixJ family response regulator
MSDLAAVVPTAVSRVREVRLVLEWLRHQGALLTAERDVAILELVATGLSYDAIAKESGLTRGRVGQIVKHERS